MDAFKGIVHGGLYLLLTAENGNIHMYSKPQEDVCIQFIQYFTH